MENEKQSSKEIWKDIKEVFGLYKISNYGRVYSVRRNVIIRHHFKRGYPRVNLSVNSKIHRFMIHRLVAKYFVDAPELVVNHIDLNKNNNHYLNLEWVTNAENASHYHAFKTDFRKDETLKIADKHFDEVERAIDMKRLNSAGIEPGRIAKLYEVKAETARKIINQPTIINRLINKYSI